MIAPFEDQPIERIAIVGMACRFPGAKDIREFWDNLRSGVESVQRFTRDELRASGVPEDLLQNPNYVPAAGFLPDFARFDAEFFGFSPREAEIIDPQQRVFLECAWQALEDAGCDVSREALRVGVFAGAGINNYFLSSLASNHELFSLVGAEQVRTGNRPDNLSTRVSYKLNLTGPSMTIQTSCSSSLVAVHLACLNLLTYQTDVALAGGVTISLLRPEGYLYETAGIRSSDGHCRAFDRLADGTVGGNGAGVVVLKRLSDAIAAGDNIRGIILGSAINNDGAEKVGYTAPSIAGQASVIREALNVSGIDASSITYIEAHGTGTAIGDPIEVKALTEAFGDGERNYCGLGSVKTNIGHLDAAAGVAGLIKTVLALEHHQIPPSLHYSEPNPQIDFDASPFYVVKCLTPWIARGGVRRAGVSSFGMGGTNAHIILEEALDVAPPIQDDRKWYVLPISARTESALERTTSALKEYLLEKPTPRLADVAYTLQTGRREFPLRRAFVVGGEKSGRLEPNFTDVRPTSRATLGGQPVFLLSGLGDQYPGMGADLYRNESSFRETVDRCAEILLPIMDSDIRTIIFPDSTSHKPATFDGLRFFQRKGAEPRQAPLEQTLFSHPALFALEYSLARLWISWGVKPGALLGHSLGEYVAACLAGVFSLEDALWLVAHRARLIQSSPPGAMLAVLLSEKDLRHGLREGVVISSLNAPEMCVVAGPVDAVLDQEQHWLRNGVACRRIEADHAFHTSKMQSIAAGLEQLLATIPLNPPMLPIASNLTGTWLSAEEACNRDYWIRQMCGPVQFRNCIQTLVAAGHRSFLEVGPARNLASFVQMTVAEDQLIYAGASLSETETHRGDGYFTYATLANLWEVGTDVDWSSFNRGRRAQKVSLPTYPFERRPYFIDRRKPELMASTQSTGYRSRIRFYSPSWRQAPFCPKGEQASLAEHWLFFTNNSSLSRSIAKELKRRGHRVTSVIEGPAFESMGPGKYTVQIQNPDDYHTLIQDLLAAGRPVRNILYGWSIDRNHTSTMVDTLEARIDQAYHGLINLGKALGNCSSIQHAHVTIVSENMNVILNRPSSCSLSSLSIGPALVIPQEYPHIHCHIADITSSNRPNEQRVAIANLVDDLDSSDSTPQLVRYEREMRWVRDLDEIEIGESKNELQLRDDGVYMITGGLGGIGLALAKHLAELAHVHIVLTTRSPFPDRAIWDTYSGDVDVTSKIASLKAIERTGSSILVRQADVADPKEMASLTDNVEQTLGAIRGVIHSAGIPGGGVIAQQTRNSANKVFESKVRGTLILADLFANKSLDFLVLCSSHRAIFGGIGRADYCAANSFLDVFAYVTHRVGFPAVSINWDTWNDTGMAVETARKMGIDIESAVQDKGISTHNAVNAFDIVLGTPLPQVFVTGRTIDALRSIEEQKRSLVPIDRSSGRLHKRPPLETPLVAPRDEVERSIAAIWQELLGIDGIGVDDNFFELGGDSVISLRISAKANQAGIKLSPRQVFENQTISQLAISCMSEHRTEAEQDLVVGPVPLSPMQRHLFYERCLGSIHFFNQAVMLEVGERLNVSSLRESLRRVLMHHDALRTRYHSQAGQIWAQYQLDGFDGPSLTVVDISECSASAQKGVIEKVASSSHAVIDIIEGPVFQAIYLDNKDVATGRLLFVCHHTVIDVISWPIIVEDLESFYDQLHYGRRTKIPSKTTSMRSWINHLIQHASSEEVLNNSHLWLTPQRKTAGYIKMDHLDGLNTVGSASTLSCVLSVEQTEALLHLCPRAFRSSVQDVLIFAIAAAIRPLTDGEAFLLTVEGHGREPIFSDVDLSRTVGWFTSQTPYLIPFPQDVYDPVALRLLSQEMQRAPHHGIEYGLLRYLSDDESIRKELAEQPSASIKLLYLGQLDQVHSSSSLFRPAGEAVGKTQHPATLRTHPIDIIAGVRAAQLFVNWTYSSSLHSRETLEGISSRFLGCISRLACEAESASPMLESSPVLGEFGWTEADSNRFLEQIRLQTS